MKSILVPTEQHALLPSTLQCALLLARKFDSYVEGFALFPAMVELYALDSGVPLPIEEVRDHDAEMAKQTRDAFETFMTKNGVARTNANGGLSFGWLDSAPDGDPFVGSYGRVFDLIVLGRPGNSRWSRPSLTTIEAGLFESGRPVLIAPPSPPQRMGDTILIAWNGSTEQATDDGVCHAAAQAGQPGHRAHRAGRNGARAERRGARPLSRPQRRAVRTGSPSRPRAAAPARPSWRRPRRGNATC